MGEVTGLPYASTRPGTMHACGHDGHTAMLLGAAKWLARNPDRFSGTVHFIFQPAEEGLGGADRMIREGLFETFPVDAVYGLHNMLDMPVGSIAVPRSRALASADTWEAVFTGKGGMARGRIWRRMRRWRRRSSSPPCTASSPATSTRCRAASSASAISRRAMPRRRT